MPQPIRAWIIRGGTSKGVYLKEADLPRDPQDRDRTIVGIFGSPDKRQIDGWGGRLDLVDGKRGYFRFRYSS